MTKAEKRDIAILIYNLVDRRERGLRLRDNAKDETSKAWYEGAAYSCAEVISKHVKCWMMKAVMECWEEAPWKEENEKLPQEE